MKIVSGICWRSYWRWYSQNSEKNFKILRDREQGNNSPSKSQLRSWIYADVRISRNRSGYFHSQILAILHKQEEKCKRLVRTHYTLHEESHAGINGRISTTNITTRRVSRGYRTNSARISRNGSHVLYMHIIRLPFRLRICKDDVKIDLDFWRQRREGSGEGHSLRYMNEIAKSIMHCLPSAYAVF